MGGAAVQRCRVHFLCNMLAQVPKGSAEMVAAAVRTIFAQPDATHVHEQLNVVAGMLGRQFPELERMLHDAATEILAFTTFSPGHWKIWSTSPAGAAQQGVQTPHRRCGGVPNPGALLRLAGAVLVEAHDEWQVSRGWKCRLGGAPPLSRDGGDSSDTGRVWSTSASRPHTVTGRAAGALCAPATAQGRKVRR
jgi:putative transposase